ncbi:MAG TPA: conjugative transposon protein TraM [Puia sp.]|nr:conjugative transposon protein TraM [Puia sp.]
MLLLAPLVALPFLCGIFVALGGGRAKTGSRATPPPGLNLQLPESFPAVRKSLTDKLGAYQRADADSMRKREFARQDPYRSAFTTPAAPDSGHAEELLSRLNRLRASLDQQATRASPSSPGTTPPATPLTAVSVTPPGYPVTPPLPPNTQAATPISPPAPPTPTDDPQLDRLNKMLDKVIRIQHPREDNTPNPRASPGVVDELLPADSTANAIPAVVPENETLVNGTSLPLRLTDPVRLHGVVIAAGTWVYGTVNFRNDRMTVDIRSVRVGNNLYPTDLQVYDLDGMPGIHIPIRLSQEVIRQSAGESVAGVDVLTPDASWQAQAANAGVQAGKNLLGRRVRQVRVTVRAGYAVLLRNAASGNAAHAPAWSNQLTPDPPRPDMPVDSVHGRLIARARTEGLELGLGGVFLQDSLLWLAIEWRNRSPIAYTPSYCRWIVRDRRHFRRMAQQYLPLEPLAAAILKPVPGDSALGQWVAFRAFALAKDKELVLQVGEREGGRSIELVISSKSLLDAQPIRHEKAEEAPR